MLFQKRRSQRFRIVEEGGQRTKQPSLGMVVGMSWFPKHFVSLRCPSNPRKDGEGKRRKPAVTPRYLEYLLRAFKSRNLLILLVRNFANLLPLSPIDLGKNGVKDGT